MLYRPSALVSPGKVTLVSTLVASTFTPAMTPPDGSVTRPVRVAVGPAKTGFVTRNKVNNTRNGKQERVVLTGVQPHRIHFKSDYAEVCRPNRSLVPTRIPFGVVKLI